MFAPLTHAAQLEDAHVLADQERAALVLKQRKGGGGGAGGKAEDAPVKRFFLETGTLECRFRGDFLFITQVTPQSRRGGGGGGDFEEGLTYYWNGPRTTSGYFTFQPLIRLAFSKASGQFVNITVGDRGYARGEVDLLIKSY